MASNVERYVDTTVAKPLDRATLNKMIWRSLNLQGSFNYERMQANGWLYGILPGLTKIHTDKADLAAAMGHNLEFYNTHPYLVTFVMGICLALEGKKADIATIRAVRVAAMGPLGGIGDAIFWFTLTPIVAGTTAQMALNGSLLAPVLYFIVMFGVQMAIRYWLMYWSYDLGVSAIDKLVKNAREFTRAASILGVMVVGALIVFYGSGTQFNGGFLAQDVEGNVIGGLQGALDSVIPALLPLALTLGFYNLLKKTKFSPVICIMILLVVGIVGSLLGLIGPAWKLF